MSFFQTSDKFFLREAEKEDSQLIFEAYIVEGRYKFLGRICFKAKDIGAELTVIRLDSEEIEAVRKH